MTPLSADDLARLRELLAENSRCIGTREEFHQFDSGPFCLGCEARKAEITEALPDLLSTVDELRSLLAEARDAAAGEGPPSYLADRTRGGHHCPACDEYGSPLSEGLIARIDAALSAEPASTD